MQSVTDAYRAEMQQAILGAAQMQVELSVVDVDAARNATASREGQMYWSDVKSALADKGAQKTSYVTFEPGRWKADGILRIADDPEGALLSEGYVSKAVSGEDGRFSAVPVLLLTFTQLVSVPALTFRFDQMAGEWCSQLQITTWKGQSQLAQHTIQPDAVEYQALLRLDGFDWLSIAFLQTSRPCRRARLSRLMFGMELMFDSKKLSEATQIMEVDPIGRRLPTETFSFSVVNIDHITDKIHGMYDPDNPNGIWKYFEQRNPITVKYGQQITKGMRWNDLAALNWSDTVNSGWLELYKGDFVEWMPGGRFYLTSQPTTDGLYATFEATGTIGILDGTYYKGIWDGNPHSLYELAQAVLEDADPPRQYKEQQPWSIWEGLKQITTMAPLPVKSHRECLQLIAHAGCCVLYTDRSGMIRIEPDKSQQTDVEVGLACILESAPKVEKTASLLQVECPATIYTPAAEVSQVHKGSYQMNGKLTLHLTWEPAAEIVVRCEGAAVVSQKLYAAAGDFVLEGSSIAALLIEGKKLETSTQNAVAAVQDADKNATAETLDNPIITDLSRASEVARWVRDYLLRRNVYTCKTRGNPEFDPMDRIQLGTEWADRVPVQVVKNQLNYSGGGLTGEMVCKREEEV